MYGREREREREYTVSVQCSVQYTLLLLLLLLLFNVGNVLLCVIYQLNFTVFIYVPRISRYVTLYTRMAFGIIRGFT
jgi:hypothetical protein